jgi:hypothetical protein
MSDERYNGWRNYQTWLANLWLDNDGHDLSEMAEDCLRQAIDDASDAESARRDASESMAKSLEAEFDEAAEQIDAKGFFADAINAALRQVDWRDIAEHHVDDVPLWSAGCNMPGYMPDSDPALFMDHGDAVSYISGELENYADELSQDEPPDQSKIDEVDAAQERVEACRDEFGETVGQYHYWITKL